MDNKKKSPAKVILTVLVYIISLGIGGYIGFSVAVNAAASEQGMGGSLLEYAAAFLLAMLVAIVTHEAGHLLFGLLTGYKFSSFRIGSLMFIKRQGRLSLCRYSLAGTGGQCLMIPPEGCDGKIPVILYNLGGVIINLVVGAISIMLYFSVGQIPLVSITLKLLAILSFLFAITNGIPMNTGGVANDGMNALFLRKNRWAAEAFRLQLVINGEISDGRRIKDIPDEYFTLPEGGDMSNVHVASLAVFACNKVMDSGQLDEALEKMNELLNGGANIIGLHRRLMINDCIYIHLLNGNTAAARSLLTPEEKKFMKAMRSYPSVIRTEYSIALVLDKNTEMAKKAKQNFEKLKKNYPYTSDIAMEEELILLIENSAKEEYLQ